MLTSLAHAQATRTWVSGVGDDVNPCSRTAPCKTFAGSISKTAAGGEINCLDPGGYGTLTITKGITIDCTGTLGGVLAAGVNGFVVQAGPGDVVILRGLDIDGAQSGLNGIRFLSGRALVVEDTRIYGFTQNGVDVEPSGNGSGVTIHNVTITANSGAGVNVLQSGAITVQLDINDVRISLNGQGVQAQNGARVAIRNSSIAFNSIGVNQTNATGGGGSVVAVDGSSIASNGTALQSGAGSSMAAFRNIFASNGTIFNPNGGLLCSGGDNAPSGNGSPGTTSAGCGGAVPKI